VKKYCLLPACRAEHHHHLTPLHHRPLLDLRDILQVFLDPFQHIESQLAVCVLAATEPHRHLTLVTILQEPAQVTQLDVVVADIGPRPELDLLDLGLLLLLACLLFLILLFEDKLAIVHDPAYGRLRVGNDFHQIQAGVTRSAEGLLDTDYSNLLSVCANEPDLRGRDVSVQAIALVLFGDVLVPPADKTKTTR